MADSIPTDKTTDKRRLNLGPAWKKGKSGNPSGKRKDGRSARLSLKPLREAILDHYQKHGQKLPGKLYRENVRLYCEFGWGKPVETVLLGGTEEAPPVRVELVEAAREAAKKL